jgi:hypothetical protein
LLPHRTPLTAADVDVASKVNRGVILPASTVGNTTRIAQICVPLHISSWHAGMSDTFDHLHWLAVRQHFHKAEGRRIR